MYATTVIRSDCKQMHDRERKYTRVMMIFSKVSGSGYICKCQAAGSESAGPCSGAATLATGAAAPRGNCPAPSPGLVGPSLACQHHQRPQAAVGNL